MPSTRQGGRTRGRVAGNGSAMAGWVSVSATDILLPSRSHVVAPRPAATGRQRWEQRSDGLAVDLHVDELDVVRVLHADRRAGHARERAVADRHVLDVAGRVTGELDRVRGTLDDQAVDGDVLYHGMDDLAEARPGQAVVHVDEEAALGLRSPGQVADVDPVDHAAPPLVRLEVDRVERGVRGALGDRVVLREDVAYPAGHLAAHGDRAPAPEELVVLDDDVLARYAHPAPVRVPPRFDHHAVVAGVEGAAGHVYVRARLRVAAVDHAAPGEHRHVADRHVLRQHRVDVPHRRVAQVYALDKDVGALVQLDEVGLQEVAQPVDPLVRVDPVDGLLLQLGPVRLALAVVVEPGAGRALAVERTGAGDRDVGLVEGVDERGEVHALDALPAGEHQRVLLRVGAEPDGAEHVQVDVVVEGDRAGPEGAASRYHHVTAAGLGAGRDGLGERGAVVGLAVALRAVPGHVEVLARERRRLDPGEDDRHLVPRRGGLLHGQAARGRGERTGRLDQPAGRRGTAGQDAARLQQVPAGVLPSHSWCPFRGAPSHGFSRPFVARRAWRGAPRDIDHR